MPKTTIKTKLCLACPPETSEHPIGDFYASQNPLHKDGKVPWCKDCIVNNSLTDNGEIDEVKFKNVLRQLDKPYYVDILGSAVKQFSKEHSYVTDADLKYHGREFIGLYFKNLNTLRQLKSKAFANSEREGYISSPMNKRGDLTLRQIVDMAFGVLQDAQPLPDNSLKIVSKNIVRADDNADKESQVKVRWSKEDKQNKKYVISMIGYDPFENSSMTEADSKYCFNILSGYCDTDGISEDGHKLQCVIQITTSLLQCKKIDDMLNHELLKSRPDEKTIQALSSSKKTIQDSINNLAKDNNISSKYSKNSKPGQNTLTAKMRQMAEDGFQSIAVNLYDIKTCEAFKQIQDLSNQSIAEQLMLDSNEYTDMIKEQREMIQKYEAEIDDLREENRNLKNKLIALEGDAAK